MTTITSMTMPDSLLFTTLLAGIGISLLSAPIGCILLWRRMVFFADSLSHSMLLGVALGIIIGISPLWVFFILSILFASLMKWAEKNQISDILLAICSYIALASALLLFYLFPSNASLESYLMGDILLINTNDLIGLLMCIIGISGFLFKFWQDLLLLAIGQDIAVSEGINTGRINWILFYLFAIAIGLMIKLTGALLAPALMIIPAFGAQKISTSPENMVIKAIIISIISASIAIMLSFNLDLIIGPTIILVNALVIFVIYFLGKN